MLSIQLVEREGSEKLLVATRQKSNARPGPFARLPFACQTSAVRLVGVLPTLTQPTIRALTKMCLDVDRVNEELSVIAIETMQTNELAAPLELTVSFYTTLLIGSSGVKFLDKSSKRKDADVEAKAWCIARRVAPRAAAAPEDPGGGGSAPRGASSS